MTIGLEAARYSGSGVGSILKGSVILWNVTKSSRQLDVQSLYTFLLTCLWNIHPHVVFVERISVCVESAQFPTCFIHLASTVHRGILLVSEHHAVAWLAFTGAFSTLAADRLVFVTFELSLAASLAVNTAEISMWLFKRE
jgi:hypothetical protein